MADTLDNTFIPDKDTGVRPQPVYEQDYLSVDTIVPQVYSLSQYGVSQAQQAAELTKIVSALLSIGVYPSIEMAFAKGVPVGTFVIIDNPETPEQDFLVAVVRDTGTLEGAAVDTEVRAQA